MNLRKLSMLILVGLLATLVAGCAPPPKRLEVLWPPPPEAPRLKWITTFASEDNFPKTDNQVMVEKVIGKEDQHFFRKPAGVASAGDGVVYVADMDMHNLRVVDFNKKTNEFYSRQPLLGLPAGLDIDSQKRLYVADADRKQVYVFTPDRQPLRSIGQGEFQRPTFLAVNEKLGRLYVSDVKKNAVIVFDLNGKKLFSFGTPGGGEGELFGPQGIAIDEENRVYVAEQFNARIQVFDADGHYLKQFGERGDDVFQFEGPRGLAFDSLGHLYVAEGRKSALLVFDRDGTPLTAIGFGRTSHQLGFVLPSGVYVDVNDRIYITDTMNRRMTVWQYLTPDYLAEHPLDAEAVKGLEKKMQGLQKAK